MAGVWNLDPASRSSSNGRRLVDSALRSQILLPRIGTGATVAKPTSTVTGPDPVVRLRVGDASETVGRERPDWFLELVDRVLDESGRIAQPSIQWYGTQILDLLHGDLSEDQAQRGTALLQRNLAQSTGCIGPRVGEDGNFALQRRVGRPR